MLQLYRLVRLHGGAISFGRERLVLGSLKSPILICWTATIRRLPARVTNEDARRGKRRDLAQASSRAPSNGHATQVHW